MKSIWRSRTIEAAIPDANLSARPQNVVRSFRRTLAASRIRVADVGGRGGLSGEMSALGPHVDLVAFEPDSAEAARLRETFSRSSLGSARVADVALGARGGARTLHVTREPGCSSLFEPNRFVLERYGVAPNYEVLERRSIETTPLADALAGLGVESIDYLKLDAQGAELEILKSLDDARLRRTLFIECEVEFVPIYENQPLFRHVDDWLSARGFELFHLSRVFWNYSGRRGSPYGRGQLAFGDAYYVRTATADLPPLSLAKLIVLAAYYGHADYAAHLFASARDRIDAAAPEIAAECDAFFASYLRPRAGWTRLLELPIRGVLDRLLFGYLRWRRWNGLKTDSDRCYPIR